MIPTAIKPHKSGWVRFFPITFKTCCNTPAAPDTTASQAQGQASRVRPTDDQQHSSTAIFSFRHFDTPATPIRPHTYFARRDLFSHSISSVHFLLLSDIPSCLSFATLFYYHLLCQYRVYLPTCWIPPGFLIFLLVVFRFQFRHSIPLPVTQYCGTRTTMFWSSV
jgi:hypothetical protein